MATKDFSSKQEKTLANYLGWDLVSGSGARDFHKGDLKCYLFLGECKTFQTLQKKIVFHKKHWDKIWEEAIQESRYPCLFTDIGTQKVEDTWVLFPIRLIRPGEGTYGLDESSHIQCGDAKSGNIRFDHEALKKEYEYACMSRNLPVIFLGRFAEGIPLGILPVREFAKLFNYR